MALRHLALKSRDLERTRRFYSELLGLREAFTHPAMLFLETPGGQDLLNFNRAPKRFDAGAGGLDHFGLRVPRRRFPALRRKLARAGVKVTGRRGRWAVYIEDPDGYTVELYAD